MAKFTIVAGIHFDGEVWASLFLTYQDAFNFANSLPDDEFQRATIFCDVEPETTAEKLIWRNLPAT